MGSMGGVRARASCLAIARVAAQRSAVCTYDTSGVATTRARSRPIDRAAGGPAERIRRGSYQVLPPGSWLRQVRPGRGRVSHHIQGASRRARSAPIEMHGHE